MRVEMFVLTNDKHTHTHAHRACIAAKGLSWHHDLIRIECSLDAFVCHLYPGRYNRRYAKREKETREYACARMAFVPISHVHISPYAFSVHVNYFFDSQTSRHTTTRLLSLYFIRYENFHFQRNNEPATT